MPRVDVVFFRDEDGGVPFLSWYHGLSVRAQDACTARLFLLRRAGHELRRPAAENLGRGIWELRAKSNRVNLRILYFFHGRYAVVVSHGIEKQAARVPQRQIALAFERKRLYDANPGAHTFRE